jgi:hypothetical protein
MLFASSFSFSIKDRKQGCRVLLAFMTYLGAPTSVVQVPAGDLRGHRGTQLPVGNNGACLAVDESF